MGRLLDGLKDIKEYEMVIAAMERVKDLKFQDAIERLQTKDEAAAAGVVVETAAMVYSTQPRGQASGAQNSGPGVVCQICKKSGHSASVCHYRNQKAGGEGKKSNNMGKGNGGKGKGSKPHKEIECFNCHKKGHFARDCRQKHRKDNRGNEHQNPTEDTSSTQPNTRHKTNSHGAWDNDEFSGMFQENN